MLKHYVLKKRKHLNIIKKYLLQPYLILFLFSFSLLFCLSRHLFSYPITPSGDLAADMLLANRIKQEGFLVVGHYSRWHFNHPGPFWFYYNEIIERLLHWSHLSRYHQWLIGSIFINSLFIAFSSNAISYYLFGERKTLFSITFILILIGMVGGEILNLWMPDRLITPYLAFVICTIHLSQGNYNYLAPSILLSNILIHGYVTMPIFTLPFLLIASIIGFVSSKKPLKKPLLTKQIIFSFLIIAFFMLPLFIDFFHFNPSNFSKILTTLNDFASAEKPSWENMQTFVNTLLFAKKSIQWLFILSATFIIILAKPTHNEQKKNILHSYITCLFITLAIICYYKNTSIPLYAYVAQFYVVIPVILIGTSVSVIFDSSAENIKTPKKHTAQALKIFSIFVCAVSLVIFTNKTGTLDSGIDVKYITNEIKKQTRQYKTIAIDYSSYDLWPLIAGILLELNDQHIKACTTKKSMAYLYTEHEICSENSSATDYIVPLKDCENDCIIDGYGIGVKMPFSDKKG